MRRFEAALRVSDEDGGLFDMPLRIYWARLADSAPTPQPQSRGGNQTPSLKENAMKAALPTTLALALISASHLCAAGDVVVSTGPYTSPVSPYQRAVIACVSSFISKILPGNDVPVRTAFAPTQTSSFSLGGYSVPIEVSLTARSAQDHALLAQSDCQVDRFARVLSLSLTSSDPSKLAGLTPADLRVAALSH
jgi:hypothetical protein